MIVNEELRCIFIHIPKNAGTTITQNLPGGRLGHTHSSEIPEEYEDFYSFAFVRNPFDRLVSLWKYTRDRYNEYPDKYKHLQSYKDRQFRLSFSEWLVSSEHYPDDYVEGLPSQKKQQVDYLPDNVSFVGRVESLCKDFNIVRATLGLPPIRNLGTANSSRHSSYKDYYTPEAIAWVHEYFKDDIREWGYTFE